MSNQKSQMTKNFLMCYCQKKNWCFHLYCCYFKNQNYCLSFSYLTKINQLLDSVSMIEIFVQLKQLTVMNSVLHLIDLRTILLSITKLKMQFTAKLLFVAPTLHYTKHTINCKYYSSSKSNSSFSSEDSPNSTIAHSLNSPQNYRSRIYFA